MLTYLAGFGDARGVDVDSEAVGYCRDRGLQQVSQATADRLPFEGESFDLVTALDVVEHIDDDMGALREMRRVLKPGGMLLLTVPAYRFLWGRQDEINLHKRRYVAREVRSRLSAAGFEIRRLSYMNSILFPGIASMRLVRHILPPPKELTSDFAVPAPGPLNRVLAAVFGSERYVLSRLDIPFGVSILALATRSAAGPERPRRRRQRQIRLRRLRTPRGVRSRASR